MAQPSVSFPFDTAEFRLGAWLVPALRRWFQRAYDRRREDRVFWPGFLAAFDIHLHCAMYAVDDLPWWPPSLVREQPTFQLAVRTPWFLLLLAYRAYDFASFLQFRTELMIAWSPVPGWRLVEGEPMFQREWSKRFSEWFLNERAIRQGNGYRKEVRFERVQ